MHLAISGRNLTLKSHLLGSTTRWSPLAREPSNPPLATGHVYFFKPCIAFNGIIEMIEIASLYQSWNSKSTKPWTCIWMALYISLSMEGLIVRKVTDRLAVSLTVSHCSHFNVARMCKCLLDANWTCWFSEAPWIMKAITIYLTIITMIRSIQVEEAPVWWQLRATIWDQCMGGLYNGLWNVWQTHESLSTDDVSI